MRDTFLARPSLDTHTVKKILSQGLVNMQKKALPGEGEEFALHGSGIEDSALKMTNQMIDGRDAELEAAYSAIAQSKSGLAIMSRLGITDKGHQEQRWIRTPW